MKKSLLLLLTCFYLVPDGIAQSILNTNNILDCNTAERFCFGDFVSLSDSSIVYSDHNCDDYWVAYSGKHYDSVSDKSYFFYCVTYIEDQGANPISHVSIGNYNADSTCLDQLSSSDVGTWSHVSTNQIMLNEGDGTPSIGFDSSTGLYGIKFDDSFPDPTTTKTYYLSVDGNPSVSTTTFLIKPGNKIGTIPMPVPTCCDNSCNISTQNCFNDTCIDINVTKQ